MEAGQFSQPSSPKGNGKQFQPLPLTDETQFLENSQDDLNVRQLLNVVRRRALVIAGVAIVVTTGIGLWTFSQTPKYEGKFQLLVEPVTAENKLTKLTQLQAIEPALNDSSLDYETQIKVLLSSERMAAFIAQIQKRYPDIDYESLILENNLTITQIDKTKILEVRYRDTDPDKIKYVLFELAKVYLRYSLQERQTNLNQGIKFVDGQLPGLQQRVDKLQGQLQTFRQRYNILDPEEQAKQLAVLASNVEEQKLDNQLKHNEVRSLYATLQKQLGLPPNQAIAAASLSEAPRYQQLLNKLKEVETKLATESARFLAESPTIQSLKEQQQNLLPLLQQEAAAVLGNNLSGLSERQYLSSPSTVRLELIQQFVDAANQVQVLEVRGNAIAQAEKRLNQQVRLLPLIARQYTDLQRELNVATESLNRFLAVRETLQIEAAQKALPWQLIAKPQKPEDPIFPKPKQNLILGAIAGVMLGLASALLAERLDNVFHSPEELKDSTRLPILGLIPHHKELKLFKPIAELANFAQPNGNGALAKNQIGDSPSKERATTRKASWYNASPFLESFRSLHTNIRFLGSDTPIHSLVVSSASPGDGKSTVSVHLAQAAAAMGQRVLLVDADLRRPQVHNVLGLENHQGLSNVIATGLTPREAIQRLPSWDNLYVLTAGQIPPDPTRLLSSKRMQYLMEQLNAVFDLVIYDTPPILGLADGRLLAVHTNGVIMVARLGKTDRSILLQAIDALKISSAPVLGMVANGVRRNAGGSYYYYDRYYTSNQESEVENAKKLLQKKLGLR
ncbi:polysaccharide biosynthesis tyrosine autokinase [Coleofasciculus sp. FACHB-T130]|uniref:GumC family protein n=1 Tax=Cyanophyceae TaxID=3028117 RepID=UPI00168280EC|nr:polysaccharide biosynthesis tyrosine autokinase [Coleofasciculus sp. FACHB-T130]MBD1878453.1 polysaccharide biosynthesis tyrosine autokinase [Coleofasciculus sp. FACHB-T130]